MKGISLLNENDESEYEYVIPVIVLYEQVALSIQN